MYYLYKTRVVILLAVIAVSINCANASVRVDLDCLSHDLDKENQVSQTSERLTPKLKNTVFSLIEGDDASRTFSNTSLYNSSDIEREHADRVTYKLNNEYQDLLDYLLDVKEGRCSFSELYRHEEFFTKVNRNQKFFIHLPTRLVIRYKPTKREFNLSIYSKQMTRDLLDYVHQFTYNWPFSGMSASDCLNTEIAKISIVLKDGRTHANIAPPTRKNVNPWPEPLLALSWFLNTRMNIKHKGLTKDIIMKAAHHKIAPQRDKFGSLKHTNSNRARKQRASYTGITSHKFKHRDRFGRYKTQ